MKNPFVSRKKFLEVVEIAEKRLFEKKHLEKQLEDETNYLLEERDLNNNSINLILDELKVFQKSADLREIIIDSDLILQKKISEIFNEWGTDKSTNHNYEKLYSFIKKNSEQNMSILEVGCGGNNPNVRHSMPSKYKPLSSLYALEEVFETKSIYGADIDETLIDISNFKIFKIDQFDKTSFSKLIEFDSNFDLIIDDGVHDIHANFITLQSLYGKLNKSGYYVIEDVVQSLLPIWSKLLSYLEIDNMYYLPNSTNNLNKECAILIKKDRE
jgi:hypothetical protein